MKTKKTPEKAEMTETTQPKVEIIPLSGLKERKGNPRTHTPEQVNQIANSIKRFGFVTPVLIDKDNVIIAGHGRVLGAKKAGIKEVPCVRVTHLNVDEVKAFVIADNKIALNAGWDDALLRQQIEELSQIDISHLEIGFDIAEIERLSAIDFSQFQEAVPDEKPPQEGEQPQKDTFNAKGRIVERQDTGGLGDVAIYFSLTPNEIIIVNKTKEMMKIKDDKELFIKLCLHHTTANS